ncbi:hypothetical protein IKO70_08565 [bacterium]|nr:hypothetical protein [bacterium]
MLPLFFLCFSVYAESSLEDYYRVFYLPQTKYQAWLKTDKNDSFKDVFAALYNLPFSKVRKFGNLPKFKEIQGLSGKTSYLYLYIEIPARTDAAILFHGIKKGEISVNGMKRGRISLSSDRGYALLKGTYEKGIYFVSVKVEEKNDKTGITVLSDKNLKSTVKQGFTKSAKSNLSLKDVDSKDKSNTFSAFFDSFCFPYFEDIPESKELFFEMTENSSETADGKTLISLIRSSKSSKDSLKSLKKLGFTEKDLEIWQKKFLKEGVCEHE